MPNWKTLGQRLAWHHRRGTVPAEAYFLTSQADVQKDHVHVGVRAWGDKRTSWLVDWNTFKRDEPAAKQEKPDNVEDAFHDASVPIASDLARLETDILAARFPVAGTNPHGFDQLAVRILGIDANYRTFEVHDFVKHAQGRYGDRVRAVRGDHKVDPTDLFRASVVERNARTGKSYEGGLHLWGIFVNAFREQLLSLFNADVDQPGAWLLTSDVIVHGQSYLRQLVNQGPVTEILPGGKSVVRWKTRDPVVGEHAWDIEVIQLALAEMVTGGEWNAAKWPRPKRSETPREAVTVALPRDFSDFSAR
jgi:phage terminase large subunit GpA-like protein